MLQSKNCIRLGQVLMDENRQFFMLCNNCHTDVKRMAEFRRHLEKCEGLEQIFLENRQFKYNTDNCTQLFGKMSNGIKEFFIYDYTDVDVQLIDSKNNYLDIINIEQELLDPKWYSDTGTEETCAKTQKTIKQYDVLMEEVTPFVQFKENFKSNKDISKITSSQEACNKAKDNSSTNASNSIQVQSHPIVKRKLPIMKTKIINTNHLLSESAVRSNASTVNKQSQNKTAFKIPAAKRSKVLNGTPIVLNSTPTQKEVSATLPNVYSDRQTIEMADISDAPHVTSHHPKPANEKQTAQILNKLQNLGLQVKRTQSLPTQILDTFRKTDDKTLEILMKLQSKGMKVKVLNKQAQLPTTINNYITPTVNSENYANTNASSINATVKPNVHKNLVIRKVN